MKSYTNLEQSKKLAEILPLESADMYYYTVNGDLYKTPNVIESEDDLYVDEKSIPCWSLAALISVLPRLIEYKGDKYYLRFMKEYVEYANDEISITGRCLHTTGNNNLIDACYQMIIHLNELNLV